MLLGAVTWVYSQVTCSGLTGPAFPRIIPRGPAVQRRGVRRCLGIEVGRVYQRLVAEQGAKIHQLHPAGGCTRSRTPMERGGPVFALKMMLQHDSPHPPNFAIPGTQPSRHAAKLNAKLEQSGIKLLHLGCRTCPFRKPVPPDPPRRGDQAQAARAALYHLAR